MPQRIFQVASFIVDGVDVLNATDMQVWRGIHAMSAARKAAQRLLSRIFPSGEGTGTIEVVEICTTPGGRTMGKSSMYHVTRRANGVLAPIGTIAFRWSLMLQLPTYEWRCEYWLKKFPENTKRTWVNRPIPEATIFHEGNARVRRMFQGRTETGILQRQLLQTLNDLTRALPHELVLQIWELSGRSSFIADIN